MSISRRQFIKAGIAVGAGLVLPYGCESQMPTNRAPSALPTRIPEKIKKFVDALPFPKTLKGPSIDIDMTEFKQQLHRDFPMTKCWGYGGSYPGPTIEVRKGESIKVNWINNLPDTHLLDAYYDTNLHGANMNEPKVRAVIHLHGGHVPPESDGFPESWLTPGKSAVYDYPNNQNATTLWYHDHSLGITRLNVYTGLAGFYLIRDDAEDALNLPKDDYEIPIVIQDRKFTKKGQLKYESRNPKEIPTNRDHPGPWIPEFFGDTIVVNGKVWPFLDVEPRKYRLRLLNGSNSRFYILSFSNGLEFQQIGTDGGLLVAPVKRKTILMAPAERADVIVDFSGLNKGTQIILKNTAPDEPFSKPGEGDPANPETTGQIMQFRVKELSRPDQSRLPAELAAFERLSESSSGKTRDMTLEEVVDEKDNPIRALLNNREWKDPIEDKPKLGTTEVWRLINLTGDTHPIHLHLVQFQILDRQSFDAEKYAEALVKARKEKKAIPKVDGFLKGSAAPAEDNESGWKDTVRANAESVTRIISRFDDYTGVYPWHCHIIEHEDNDMMLKYEVVK